MDGTNGRCMEPLVPQGLGRQPSVYSLTFDEFQTSMGKDFGSMNMDELLRSIWSADEILAVTSSVPTVAVGASAAGTGIQGQGSLTLPRTLSQKTVEEVWRSLPTHEDTVVAASSPAAEKPKHQVTLGRVTIEKFLQRAGVVKEDNTLHVANNNAECSSNIFFGEIPDPNDASMHSFGFTQAAQATRGLDDSTMQTDPATNLGLSVVKQPLMQQFVARMVGEEEQIVNTCLMPSVTGLGGGLAMVAVGGSPANQLASDMIPMSNVDLSSGSPVPYPFNETLKGKKSNGAVEKVMERRQRRMIKNRESAARSRARKQAYTMELEAEVAKLKEQNEELQKKQEELLEMQKNEQLQMINQQCGSKRQCLRRTQTGPW